MAHPKVWEGLGDQPGRLEAHPHDREGLGRPPGGEGGVKRPTRRSGRGQEAHPEDREWS